MRLGERWSLIAICSATAIASAAAVIVLDAVGFAPIGPRVDKTFSETKPPSIPKTNSSVPQGRLATVMLEGRAQKEDLDSGTLFAARGDRELPLFRSVTEGPDDVSTDNPVDEAVSREHETPEWWSAKIRREPPPTSPAATLSVTAQPKVPWRAVAPGPLSNNKLLGERLSEFSPAANTRLGEKFTAAQASWPPTDVALVAIKDEKTLELHARGRDGVWAFVHRYPVLAASGGLGPKLRQGDHQVPEGIYGITFLNPNSRFHVSLRVNYPNAFDRQMAAKDGRVNLGGDIMIHGKNVSTGCLAIGDEAAEELFVLAARIGLSNIKLIIAPTDFRRNATTTLTPAPNQPKWLPDLYAEVAKSMVDYKRPPSNSLLSFFGK